MKTLTKKSVESSADFYEGSLILRNTTNKTGLGPAQKLFSRRTRCSIPVIHDKLNPKINEDARNRIKAQSEVLLRYK